jgi:peroxiredoxin
MPDIPLISWLRNTVRRPRLRRTLEALVWAGLLGFIGYRLWPQVAAAFAVGGPGEAAPPFLVTTLEGKQVSLESLRGQVVLLNFWATWCAPCRIEMPGFERVYQAKKNQGFVIVGLSTDWGASADAREYVARRGVTFPVAMASGEIVRSYGGIRTIPTSILIDRNGRARYTVTGIFAEPALRLAVNRLLAEPGPRTLGAARTAIR